MAKYSFSKYILSLIILLIPVLCFAQKGRINGRLTFSDGKPVAFATVYIDSLKVFSMSNDKGMYKLEAVPYGTYTIGVSTLEAEHTQAKVSVNKAEVSHSVVLKKKHHKMGKVVVRGKSKARELKEQGFAVDVVDMRKAETQSIQAADLLDRTAGVRIRQSGGMGSRTQYNINGLSGDAVRIFIDGIPIRNYGSSFSLSSLPPSVIERIEVYKGVVPAELAEDALGGAINIVLRQKAKNTLSTSYSFGSFNTHRWDMNGSYSAPKSGFTLNGSAFFNSTDNDYKVWGDQIWVTDPLTGEMTYVKAKRFHDDYRSYGINADFGFTDVKWADKFLIGVLFSDMAKDIQHGSTMSVVYGNRTSAQNTLMGNLKYDKRDILKNLDVSLFGSYSHGVREVVDTVNHKYNWLGYAYRKNDGSYYTWNTTGEAGRATLAENTEKMIAGRGNVSYRFLSGQKLSAHYLYNHFIRDIEDPMLPQAEQNLLETRYLTKGVGGFTYEGSWLKNKLKTTVFYKHYYQKVELSDPKKDGDVYVADKYDRSVNEGGYGGAISYEIIPQLMLSVSGEKALRLPSDTELLGNTSENINAAYDLEPESSVNLNFGASVGAFKWGNHSLWGNFNIFYRDVKDMIARNVQLTSSNNEATSTYVNLDKVLSTGMDVEVNYDFKHMITVTSNLSLFNARFNSEYDQLGAKYSYYRDRICNAPYFTSNTNIEFSKRDIFQKGARFSVYYNFGYVHKFYRKWDSWGDAGKQMVPSQRIHDLGASYTFPKGKVTLSVDARNFTNEQVFDNWALQKAGRAFYGKISYRIF